VSNHENRTVGGVDQPGGDTPEQEAAAGREAPRADDYEVLRISAEVIEQRLEHFTVQCDGLHQPCASSQGDRAHLFEHGGERPTVGTDGHQGLES